MQAEDKHPQQDGLALSLTQRAESSTVIDRKRKFLSQSQKGTRREMNLPLEFEADEDLSAMRSAVEKPFEPARFVAAIRGVLNEKHYTHTPKGEEVGMAKRALIIDDNAEFAGTMMEVLKANGYEVITAITGGTGYDKAVETKPDFILLDVMMEDAGAGLDTVTRLKDNEATVGIPVFLVTGIKKPEFLLNSYAPGKTYPNVKGTFEKPMDPKELIKTLAAVV